MIRTLALIAVTGFVLCVACLGSAFAIAGPEFISRGGWDWNWDGDHARWDRAADQGPETTRDFAWSGGDRLEIEVPGEVRYVQAAGPAKLTISGPQNLLDRIVVENGRIGFGQGHVFTHGRRGLEITLTAPDVKAFDMSGSNRLTIENYAQKTFDLDMSGSGEAVVSGAAETAHVQVSGSGEADLRNLKLQGADVDISGSGDATINAAEWARLDISGSGGVDLVTKPKRLESDISGSGEVHGGDAPAAPEPPTPPRAT